MRATVTATNANRLDAGNSTRARPRRWQTRQKKDETSRDIGIASLPLRACRPSGGFVLGTLSAAAGPVKRF
jgi:hypothetical protein